MSEREGALRDSVRPRQVQYQPKLDGARRSVRHRQSASTAGPVHLVCCPYCQRRFNLFAASWCSHEPGQPSKICPACARCLCQHPAYLEPHFWKAAPQAFQQRGFDRLFLFYL
jgi:hypothetical protein